MNKPFSFEIFQYILEHDDIFSINDTLFYFNDEPKGERVHYLGCDRRFDKPYWVGYCDIPDGEDFSTAEELLNAKIFNGKSIKDRWENLVIEEIGAVWIKRWIDIYGEYI